MNRLCVGCGIELPYNTPLKKKRCKKDCGRNSKNHARTERREKHDVKFIGVDGEGVTYCANCHAEKTDAQKCAKCGHAEWMHDYVLLTVGDNRPLSNADGSHLHWQQIFEYLYDCFLREPEGAYVGFFLGYDFTQWLKTLPETRASSLLSKEGIALRARKKSGKNHRPFPVHVGTEDNPWAWEIDTLAMKRFSLRPGTGLPPGKAKNPNRSMNICDTGSFFQKRFIDVIASHVNTLITPEEFNTILEGKTKRSTAQLDEDMIRYNALENDILSRVMNQLNRGFSEVGIRLNANQWFGPGQAAQKWLSNISATPAEELYKSIPKEAADAARQTYYGGWFEIFRHGIIPGVSYEYDINSAYPHAISELPCLLHGEWSHVVDPKYIPDAIMVEDGFRMMYCHVKGSDSIIGSMPHRTKNGAIQRPSETKGWYWEHELNAAILAGLVDTYEVEEYIQYDYCPCPKPFRNIAELYKKRLAVGKNTPSGMAYKLVYNSAYGKMAQSIGKPKYANSIYASLITSMCRTRILTAILMHPKLSDATLMVATDGVYFSEPTPYLELDNERLGYWSVEEKHNLCLFMPGVYWDDKSRKALREGTEVKVKSRGISARDLSMCISSIDEQFKEMGSNSEWPNIEIPINFNMTSAKLALSRGKWHTAGDIIFDGIKRIDSNPKTKRNPTPYRDENGNLATYPYSKGTQLETTPYDKRFAQAEENNFTNNWEITPDGSVRLDLTAMLNGA